MKTLLFILSIVFLASCTGGGGYNRQYIISDAVEERFEGEL